MFLEIYIFEKTAFLKIHKGRDFLNKKTDFTNSFQLIRYCVKDI